MGLRMGHREKKKSVGEIRVFVLKKGSQEIINKNEATGSKFEICRKKKNLKQKLIKNLKN